MKSNPAFLALAVVLGGAVTFPTLSFAQGKPKPKGPAPRVAVMTFNKNIKATMTKECAGCHTGAGAPEGIDLSSYAKVMKGGKHGKVIVPGNPAKSVLYTVLKGKPKLMPPKHALDAKTIAAVEAWIKQGAREK
jgi:mono/diheme cytochrome c family protein